VSSELKVGGDLEGGGPASVPAGDDVCPSDSEADEARIHNKMRLVKRQFCSIFTGYDAIEPVNERFLQNLRYNSVVILELT
jgi:hypothetical protein